MKPRSSFFFSLVLSGLGLILWFNQSPTLSAQRKLSGATDRFNALKQKIGSGAVIVTELDGTMILGLREEQLYVPASILKIATAYVGLQVLGPEFRFSTWFFTTAQGDLVVKGGGDPHLVSEEWDLIAKELASRCGKRIGTLFMDDSYFEADLAIPGRGGSSNPYDAFVGALSSNFNTINVCNKGGKIASAESQTPLTPLARELARTRKLGSQSTRIRLEGDRANVLRYSGELLLEFLRKQGCQVEGSIRIGPSSDCTTLVYEHRNTRVLTAVVRDMLKYSNNFIANQLFLVAGVKESGPPANLQKGRDAFFHAVAAIAPKTKVTIVEGSGLSRQNLITARWLAAVLCAFHKDYRELLSEKGQVKAKTGTLSDVRSLAGYFPGPNGKDRVFVILLEGNGSKRDAVVTELRTLFGA